VLFYVVLVCKCVLPPGDNPIAVNKYYYLETSRIGAPYIYIYDISSLRVKIYNTTRWSQATLGYNIIYWRGELCISADSRPKV